MMGIVEESYMRRYGVSSGKRHPSVLDAVEACLREYGKYGLTTHEIISILARRRAICTPSGLSAKMFRDKHGRFRREGRRWFLVECHN